MLLRSVYDVFRRSSNERKFPSKGKLAHSMNHINWLIPRKKFSIMRLSLVRHLTFSRKRRMVA